MFKFNKKPRNIILSLGDDKDTVDSARRLAKNFASNTGRETIVIPFGENCLQGLSKEEIADMTIVGHADKKQYGNGQNLYSPRKFVEVFANEVKNAGFKNSDVKQLRCFGCELGLKTPEDEICQAQKMANQFQIQGFDLKLNAFSNTDPKTPLEEMSLRVLEKGDVYISGFRPGESEKALELEANIKQQRNLMQKGSTRAEVKLAELMAEYKKVVVVIQSASNPFRAINEERHCFTPRLSQLDLINVKQQLQVSERKLAQHKVKMTELNPEVQALYQNNFVRPEEKINQNLRQQLKIIEAKRMSPQEELAFLRQEIARRQSSLHEEAKELANDSVEIEKNPVSSLDKIIKENLDMRYAIYEQQVQELKEIQAYVTELAAKNTATTTVQTKPSSVSQAKPSSSTPASQTITSTSQPSKSIKSLFNNFVKSINGIFSSTVSHSDDEFLELESSLKQAPKGASSSVKCTKDVFSSLNASKHNMPKPLTKEQDKIVDTELMDTKPVVKSQNDVQRQTTSLETSKNADTFSQQEEDSNTPRFC